MPVYESNPDDFTAEKQAEQDAKLLVKFEIRERQDLDLSAKEGRPIFKEVEYIDIRIPGDRSSTVCRPATFHDKQRFPKHYEAFKERVEYREDGTPLTEWPLIPRTMVNELAFFNVKTVEHLVSMSDSNAQKFAGIRTLQQKAKDWLDKVSGDAVESRLREEINEKDAKISSLEEVILNLKQRVDALEQE